MRRTHLGTIGLVWLVAAGCNSTAPPATIAKAAAPRSVKVEKPAQLPTVKFIDVTKESGVNFTHSNGMEGQKYLPETMGSGIAFLDYDLDGDQDLFLVNSCAWGEVTTPKPTQCLYQNDGKGKFRDVTAEVGLDQTLFGMGVAVGDYDNDGDPDLYVTAVGGGHLYRNDKGKFVDVTKETKSAASDGWLTSAAFFDLENDGDLDLFVCCYVSWTPEFDKAQSFNLAGVGRSFGPPNAFKGGFCVLLRNDGGTFADISEEAGIRRRKAELGDPMAKALGVAPQDVDGDGLVDLAVVNDTVPNFLFHNLGGGKFEEIGIIAGMAFDQNGSPRGAMGTDWGDFRNDGSLGLAVANFANEMIALFVTDDPKELRFSDMATYYGLGAPTQPPLKFGLFFFDYDLDGRLDLLSANGHLEPDITRVQASETYPQSPQLFWNSGRPGREKFVLVSPEAVGEDLFKPIVGRGSAFADFDGDGDMDVALAVNGGQARILRNDGGNTNRWVRLKLRGQESNRDAIGARIKLTAGNVTQSRQLFPARGYLSSVQKDMTFGVGESEEVREIEIVWPSGKTTRLGPLKSGVIYDVDEKDGLVAPKSS